MNVAVLYTALTRSGGAFQHLRVAVVHRVAGPTTPTALLQARLVWAPPISLATTLGISVDFFSSGY
jgi:hypothetical protein